MTTRAPALVWLGVALVFAAAVVLPLWLAFDGAPSLPDGLAASPGFRDQGPSAGVRVLSGPHAGGPVLFLVAPPPIRIDVTAAGSIALGLRDALCAPGHIASREARLL